MGARPASLHSHNDLITSGQRDCLGEFGELGFCESLDDPSGMKELCNHFLAYWSDTSGSLAPRILNLTMDGNHSPVGLVRRSGAAVLTSETNGVVFSYMDLYRGKHCPAWHILMRFFHT